MARLTWAVFPAFLLILWACGDTSHAQETGHAHAHLAHSPTHAHTLGRWAGVPGRNLSCGNLNDSVLFASIIVDFIDEFKDSYTNAIVPNLSWDEMDSQLPTSDDSTSIQVCVEGNTACIDVLPVLPSQPDAPPQTEQETKMMMIVMIGYLQRYSVAAETLVLDQSLNEDDMGFLNEMVDLQTYLEELIMVFLTPMTSCQLTPDPHLEMNLSRRMYQQVGEVSKQVRGFRGLRQIRLGLLYMISMFSQPQGDAMRPQVKEGDDDGL